jgi:hypothetical protein
LEINTKTKRRGPSTGREDTYVEQLLKLVPAEAVTLYIAGTNLIPNPIPENQKIIPVIWLIVCLGFVILLRSKITKDDKKTTDWMIVGISAVSFLIYAYSLGGVFETFGIYLGYFATLIIMAWTAFTPFIYKNV